jgi:S1-C subfamily serine protease
MGSALQATTPVGTVKCRVSGWVKQVGGKILPLALLRVDFEGLVPPRGTPLWDSSGKVAALVFQESGTGNTAYAIPAEAVNRVRGDVCNGGHLVRGWIGFSLRADNPSPQIVRVLAGSPAASAGIKPGDVLLQVGDRQINDYADAVNAFFYLVPGRAVGVKILRGGSALAFKLTPTRSKTE